MPRLQPQRQESGLRLRQTQRFSLHHRAQTCSRVHPTFYPMLHVALFLWTTCLGREVHYSRARNAEIKNAWSKYLHISISLHCVPRYFYFYYIVTQDKIWHIYEVTTAISEISDIKTHCNVKLRLRRKIHNVVFSDRAIWLVGIHRSNTSNLRS
jgi:hypothetical protein